MNQENMNQGVNVVPQPQVPVQPQPVPQPQAQPQVPVQPVQPQPQVQPQVPVQPQPQVPVQPAPVVQPQPVPQPQPQPQVQPQVPNVQTAAQAPVAQAPVLEPIPEPQQVVEEPVPEIQESVVPKEPGEGDAEDITFDYNQLYGIQAEDIKVEEPEEESKPVFTTQDIVINENTVENRANGDVTPVFNMNDLDSATGESNKLTDNVRDAEGQSKADTRRGLVFIAVIVLILVIFVWFIFPIIAGYKM